MNTLIRTWRGWISALFLLLSPFHAEGKRLEYLPAPGMSPAAVANDYFGRLRTHTLWTKFPVRIYFSRNEFYTPRREKQALNGFSCWVQATHGYTAYQIVDKAADAQMSVSFDPDSGDGHTTIQFRKDRLMQANIQIGVRQDRPKDIECIAAHEYGHALGINGHSENVDDLMYPTHVMGTPWRITQRDLNTLAAIYRANADEVISWRPQSG